MNLFELFVKIGVDDQASDKISSLSSKLGNGLKTAAKIGTAAIGTAAAGITALTTTAVNNYAEYEQLVGGAELLFGDAFDFVQGKASEAYKNVQMSQSEYLQQVNGFATGLKTALGGNSQAAAELADRIITAEADIVAATGASQEMVQNAFNGIMRSNYVMLDNLQLGITPTKEGFQEVIDIVNKWNAEQGKATDYQIDNLADAQSALLDYIEMQGLSGYAAMEASNTISGSIASVKSAWANLVTGIADDNANVGQLIDNLIDSAVVAAWNILPRIEKTLTGIGELIEGLAPVVIDALPGLISNVLPSLLDTGLSLLMGIIDGIIENLPLLVESTAEIIVTIANGITENLPELIPTIVDVVIQIVETMIENVDMLIDAAIAIILALADGLINSLPELIEEIPGLVMKIVNAIIENAPKLLDAAVEIIAKLTSGLIEGFLGIASKVGGWLYDNIVQPIVDKVSDFKDAGKQLLEGLWDGIEDKVEWLKGKVSGVVDTIKGWFTSEEGFDEHSPSKWAKKVFQYVMEGGGEGLDAGLPSLMQSVGSVTDRVKSGLDFGTASVDFAYSGLGMSSAGIINSAASNSYSNSNFPSSIELRLSSSDGQTLGRWLVPFVRSENRSNPEVVSDI